ncbi:phosphotransferase [Mucilaginibacter sp.]|uniref:phosphotransferase enzyme family protein n=1 Tax=Mucilaginibacter sp. TaxID=1882438 RepID=UPI00263106DA|nr:phosphotransferase [Mucilaginibacter sp.]MDB4922915.1 hypothetical protein [Mucilaginibacter sp.]
MSFNKTNNLGQFISRDVKDDAVLEYFVDRVEASFPWEQVEEIICKEYGIRVIGLYVINIGYDDLNFRAETDAGPVFIKFFCKEKTLAYCLSAAQIIKEAAGLGIVTPGIVKNLSGFEVSNVSGAYFSVMDYVTGGDYYSNEIYPGKKDIEAIITNVNLFQYINTTPIVVYNPWSAINFTAEYNKNKYLLTSFESELIQPTFEKFATINLGVLPKSFVHGDILRYNVIRSTGEMNWIVDYGSCSILPRIFEFAVMCNDILFNTSDLDHVKEIYDFAFNFFHHLKNLDSNEIDVLPIVIQAGFALSILAARAEKQRDQTGDPSQHDYWIDKGNAGLNYFRTTNFQFN